MLCADRLVAILRSSKAVVADRNSVAETIIDKALECKYIGGVYGNQRPTEYICLLLKLLQIQPEKEILVEYLRADEFKCVFFAPTVFCVLTSLADTYVH